MLSEKELKKLDMVLLVLFPLAAVLLSHLFHAGLLLGVVLFFGPLSLWFSYRTPHAVKKTLFFSAITSIPVSFVMTYLIEVNKGWWIPHPLLPRLFGVAPLDEIIWSFVQVYVVIIFYEHFLHKGKHELVDKRMKYFTWPAVVIAISLTLIILAQPQVLQIPYAYFTIFLAFVIVPAVTFLSFFPRLLSNFLKVACYFFIVSLMYEITAIRLDHWRFIGSEYIGWVELFGHRFPFEEFMFLGLISLAILCYYEFFDEDPKRDNARAPA